MDNRPSLCAWIDAEFVELVSQVFEHGFRKLSLEDPHGSVVGRRSFPE
jgi:hypothetical protein